MKAVSYVLAILMTLSIYAEEEAKTFINVDEDSLAEIDHEYDRVRFRKGVRPVGNKKDHFLTIPDQFDGWCLTELKDVQDRRKPVKFTAETIGNVLVISQVELENQEWAKVAEFDVQIGKNSQKAWVFMKYFESGEYEVPSKGWMATHLLWD